MANNYLSFPTLKAHSQMGVRLKAIAGGKKDSFCNFWSAARRSHWLPCWCDEYQPLIVRMAENGSRLQPRSRDQLLYCYNDMTAFSGIWPWSVILFGSTLQTRSSSTASSRWVLNSRNCSKTAPSLFDWPQSRGSGRFGSSADPPTCKIHKKTSSSIIKKSEF